MVWCDVLALSSSDAMDNGEGSAGAHGEKATMAVVTPKSREHIDQTPPTLGLTANPNFPCTAYS